MIILIIPISQNLYAAPTWYENVTVSKVTTIAASDGSTSLYP